VKGLSARDRRYAYDPAIHMSHYVQNLAYAKSGGRFFLQKFGIDVSGNFLNVYSNMNRTPVQEKYFNNVVVKS
jgi:hypothetical protein